MFNEGRITKGGRERKEDKKDGEKDNINEIGNREKVTMVKK